MVFLVLCYFLVGDSKKRNKSVGKKLEFMYRGIQLYK